MRRHGISLAGLVVVSVVLAVVIRFGPALSFSLALASPSTETWLASFQEQARREDIVLPAAFGGLRTDLYRPARSRGVLLLVHGLSRAGRRQPDLVRLARLLGAHGLIVVVPQFEGLTAFRLSGREVDDVRAALAYTTTLGKPPAIAGFSFGAGPALLAAASFPDLRVAASFGGYADLTHVIAYVTTGAHSFAEHRYVRKQEEYNRWKLLALLVAFVQQEPDRQRLDEIARRKLANPGDDTRQTEATLGAEGQAVLALALNRREDAVPRLLAGLPTGAREALGRLSPLRAVSRIHARLLIAHGTDDDSIPFTESLRLAAAAGPRVHLALFRTFHHTGPEARSTLLVERARDGWTLVQLVDALLPR